MALPMQIEAVKAVTINLPEGAKRDKAIAARSAQSLDEFKTKTEAASTKSEKHLLDAFVQAEVDAANVQILGLAAEYQSGIALEAMKLQVNAKRPPAKLSRTEKKEWTKANNWDAYVKESQVITLSKSQCNKRIRLASLMSFMPERDELGQTWKMRSFERWALDGTSIDEARVLKLTKFNKRNATLAKAGKDLIPLSKANVDMQTLTEKEQAKVKPATRQAAEPLTLVSAIDQADAIVQQYIDGRGVTARFTDEECERFTRFASAMTTMSRNLVKAMSKPAAKKTRKAATK